MAQYLPLPDGSYLKLQEGESPAAGLQRAQQKYPEAFVPKAPAPKPEGGFLAAAKAGATELGGGISALMGKVGLKDEAKAEAEYQAAKKRAAEIFKPTEEGWTEAPFTKFKELLGGSIPYMAAPLAAGAAAATLPVTGTAAALTTLGAAGLTSAGQFTATNLARQMEEGKTLGETSLGSAAAAAIPQAALDTLSMRMIPGIGRIFGQAGVKITAENAKEIAEQGLKKTLADYAAKTGKTAGIEGATEAAQQVFERLQAGLSITDPQARQEYFDSFLGGAILGGTLAPVGRAVERGREQREARGLLEKQAQEERAATLKAETERKKTPEYLLDLDTQYNDAVAKMRELQAAVKQKPAKDADPAQWAEYNQKVAELKEFTANTMRPITAEYTPRKAEIAKVKEQQRVAGMSEEEYADYTYEQALKRQPKTAPIAEKPEELSADFADIAPTPAAPKPAPELAYAQQRMSLAQQQDQGAFEAKDFAEYLMQDPAMAQRLVETKTAIPGVSKKESDAILGGLKLQLQDRVKQERAATQEELQQRQADLKAQQLPAETDPLALWKASVEETEDQATEELLRPNFETLRPSGPATVTVAPGITPMQNPGTLLKRLDDLTAARDKAAADAETAFAAGNKELGIKKSQEREAAQTALNNIEQAEGTPRALLALRKAQDTALMNAAQLIDDLRVGRTLGGPEAATASSTPQTLINQINKQRDAFVTAAVQEAAATRRLFAKALSQEEAETAAKQMRDVFNEWVTRSMAQPRAAVLEERVTQPAQMRGTEVVRGAETEMVDPRPLEERRFGAYRAATQVLQEQLRQISSRLSAVPKEGRRVEPTLKMQFPETEAAKVAEASGETAQTLEGALRRRRDYVGGLIDQAFQTRKVPGIAQMLLTRAQDFIPNATNNFLDAAENIASRILRGQNIERGDLVTMRDEIRAAAMRPGEAEVAGEREGQRELFPAEERRALAPKQAAPNLVGQETQAGALGTIREKPEAFQAVRAKSAAKQQRADAAAARGEKLTQDIKRELDRIDVERQQALEARVDERRDSLQSAWQSAVKKAKDSVIAARRVIQKDKLKGLKTEIDAIRSGGIEGLNKETIDRLLALRQQADDLVTQFDTIVEAAEFLPLAQANKWVAFERGALDQAQKALEANRTPQTMTALAQQQAALQRAETARLQNLKGEEKAAEAARMRAAQQGLGLPGVRREAGKVTPIEPEKTVEQKQAEAQESRAEARAAAAETAAAKQAELGELEQRVLDLGTQVAEREAAQKRARTPESKARIQEEIDALNKDATLAQAQLAALQEGKPRRKGPATAPTSAALGKRTPLRTGYRKALEAASEGVRKEREGETRVAGTSEREEDIDIGGRTFRAARGVEQESPDLNAEQVKALEDNDAAQALALVSQDPSADKVHRAVAQRLAQLLDDTKVEIKDNLTDSEGRPILGQASADGKEIQLDRATGLSQEVLLHEATHAAAERTLLMDEARLTPMQLAAKRELQAIHAMVKKDSDITSTEAKGSLSEFVAEVMSNAKLQQQLAKKPWSLSNMLAGFKSTILRLIGVKDAMTMLTASIKAVDALFMPTSVQTAPVAKTMMPARAVPSMATANRVADSLIAKEKGWLTKLKDNFLGMGGRTQFVDKLAPSEEALKRGGADPAKALQAMYYLRMYDQRMHFTSQSITEGVPELVEKTRRDGTTERLIETKPGANIQQIVDILKGKDVVKAAGSADGANKLFTLYLAAIRGERVGYDTLNFGRVWAEAEVKRIESQLKATTISQEQRAVLQKRKKSLEEKIPTMPTAADIKAARAEIEADPTLKKAFDEARDIYNQYNRNLLEFSVQTGALSREQANEYLRNNDYIPYYRMRDGVAEMVIGNETPIRIGNLKDSPHLKELVGGDEAIFDFLTSSVQNTSMLLDMATKNLATKNLMFELRDVGLATVAKVPKSGKTPEGAVTFKRDGEDHYAVVDTDTIGIDSDLLVKGLAGIPTMFPAFVRVLGVPARLLRRVVVASPVYMARQLFRDSLAAALTSGADITPVLGSLKQIGKPNALQSRGITGGQVFTGMPEDVTRMLKDMQAGKISVTNGLSWLEAKAAQVDALTRKAQYESYLAQGLSEMEATYMALESMNFSKRGLSPTMHMVSTLIPFFNAQIQGLDVLYKSFTGQMPLNERLAIREKLWTRGLMLAGMSMVYAMYMQDDETYENAKPEEKYGNWFVRVPGFEQMVRLPIPFELGYIFKALPEAMVNTAMNDKGGEEAMKAAKHIAQQMVPGASSYFLPQAVKTGLEVAVGKSIYTGRDIESTQEQMMEPGYRYRDNTTALAREVGELTGFSPVKMEFLIRGYTGSMGMAMLGALSAPFGSEGPEAATKRASDLPVVGTLFQPKDASGIIDATYERMKQVNQVKETYEGLLNKGRQADAEKYLKENIDEMALASVAGSFKQYMGQITEYERQIRASNLTPEKKREALDQARQAKIQLATSVRAATERKAPQAAPA